MKAYVKDDLKTVNTLGMGSQLKTAFRDQKDSFLRIIGELADGNEVHVLNETISLKDNMIGATLAVNQYMSESSGLTQMLWKIFQMTDELMKQSPLGK